MMRRVDEYMEVNRANWDQRAPAHAKSPEYNLPRFIDDSAFIGEVVQFDRALLDDVTFVESDVYDAASALGGEQFDLVFTGIGALCWLPSISRWAATVAALLKPGGRLFIREGHPMLWSLADARPDGLLVVDLPYFERDEPSV